MPSLKNESATLISLIAPNSTAREGKWMSIYISLENEVINVVTPLNMRANGSLGHSDSGTDEMSTYTGHSPFSTTLTLKLGIGALARIPHKDL